MSGRIVIVLAVIVAWFVAVTASTGKDSAPPGIMPAPDAPSAAASSEGQMDLRGCVIRFDRRDAAGHTKPRIHVNEMHYCIGVDRVHADHETGDLVIQGPPAGPIVFITVSPDETMTQRGIDCGASGGAKLTKIRCYDRDGGQVPAHSPELYGREANLWIGWLAWAG